jgi:ArsR family transcriptional regulator, arsenate/arsenite/antimonite-responsive transcriptional repressor / arsenate reductase (thioredoxin)
MTASSQPPAIFKLLAHELRWRMFKLLIAGDYRVHELVENLNQPMNLISYHLKKLRVDSLVIARRSEADGRDVYYSLNPIRLRQKYLEAGSALHPALISPLPSLQAEYEPMRVLFLCTHNSARSQMAEALLRHLGNGNIEAYSAGIHPTQLHPDAVRTMDEIGIDIRHQKSKSLRIFEGELFDYVITVCDQARENCPTFPDKAVALHWGFTDPTALEDEQQRIEAFKQTAEDLKSRIEYLLSSRLLHAAGN